MSASDAVILLVADGLVAVGRVLRGLRRPSGAEVRAQAVGEAFLESPRDWFHVEPGHPYERPYDEVAALVEAEAEQEVWEGRDV